MGRTYGGPSESVVLGNRSYDGVAYRFPRLQCQKNGLNDYVIPTTMNHLIFLIAIGLPFLVHADVQGMVVGITDGDTISILDSTDTQHKVRLAGIDAPEKSQAFGQASKKALSDCAFGKMAVIEGDKMDRYKRLVGKVMVNGYDCNLSQVKHGMAWHYKQYQREQSPDDRLTYSEAEEQARNKKVGLWAEDNPMPPWDFRHRLK